MNAEEIDAYAAANAKAPRISLAHIKDRIDGIFYITADQIIEHHNFGASISNPDKLQKDAQIMTVCMIVMTNGFRVIGHSTPASPDNFNAELGREFAFDHAIKQLWPILGFELCSKLRDGAVS